MHARRGEQNRGIVFRNNRSRWNNGVTFVAEESQKETAEFVSVINPSIKARETSGHHGGKNFRETKQDWTSELNRK
jgi:hypothetical protein